MNSAILSQNVMIDSGTTDILLTNTALEGISQMIINTSCNGTLYANCDTLRYIHIQQQRDDIPRVVANITVSLAF